MTGLQSHMIGLQSHSIGCKLLLLALLLLMLAYCVPVSGRSPVAVKQTSSLPDSLPAAKKIINYDTHAPPLMKGENFPVS